MATDTPGLTNLNDPPQTSWDPLFNTTTTTSKTPIHGVIKVAGSSLEIVNNKLTDIKNTLNYPTLIVDIAGNSLPTNDNSRVDGQVRPKSQGLNGHEQ